MVAARPEFLNSMAVLPGSLPASRLAGLGEGGMFWRGSTIFGFVRLIRIAPNDVRERRGPAATSTNCNWT
jgi:hypothetical protein